jgi:chromosome segregation ATPase
VDLEELEALSEKARELDKKIAEAETQLATLLAGESVETLEQQCAKAAKVLEGIRTVRPKWKGVPPDVANLTVSTQESRQTVVAAVGSAETAWEVAHSALTAASTQKATLEAKLEEVDKQVSSLKVKVTRLTADGRTSEEQETALNKLALSWDAAKAALKEVEEKLQEFGEDPRAAATKLDKQLQGAEEAATKALEAEKIEEGKLAHLAAQGPYSALAQAEEEVTALKEEVAREELRISAVRLLYDTVTQCRTEALATVLVPVQLAATRTLQRIAGGRLGKIQLGETFEPAHVLPQQRHRFRSITFREANESRFIWLPDLPLLKCWPKKNVNWSCSMMY